jgi:hypothetical protein
MESMMMLLFVLLLVVVAYMLLAGGSVGGLFTDCKELRDKYGVEH